MSWKFTLLEQPLLTITVRNAELGDADRDERRQAVGETDGGAVFVEDLGATDEFVDATFASLSVVERADLEKFFGTDGANKRAKPFSIEISGRHKVVPLNTGQVIDGVPLNTGQGFNTGQLVLPDIAVLPVVFLDQSDIIFAQPRPRQFTTTMRFRLSSGGLPKIL